jgi:putative oxygen-independent coproporphyrinogen III oxidase
VKAGLPREENNSNTSPHAAAGLYIHVPFCTSVCPYCDFAVLIAGEERRASWADGVVEEARLYEDLGLVFDTVYLGGGTPSCTAPGRLAAVLEGVAESVDIVPDAEVYLEANPEDVSSVAAAAWRDLGIAMVSLGVQSLDDRELAFLGRRHTADQARRAAEVLLESGFHTVSLDLIFGLQGQTAVSWRDQLEQAVALGADHLSCYQLTFHEGTVLGRRKDQGLVRELGDDEQAELFDLTHELLADAGYRAYEVSNFARSPAHRSRHNSKYWDHTPYLGLGPSAHSFAGGRRWWNRRKLRLWRAALDQGQTPVEGEELLSDDQLLLEAVMLSLRTPDGIDLALVEERFGLDLLAANAEVVDRWQSTGHLVVEEGHIRPTVRGLAIADSLARSFELRP